jgi:hypothetical protein
MEYKTTYDKTFYEVQGKIKEALIKAKFESRTFNFALNAIIHNDQELINKSLITSNKSLSLLEVTFKKSISCYSENAIELALKNDIYPGYLKLNDDELPTNYLFQNFVFDLASLHALKEISRLFNNHSKLFEMMFELNDFKNFEIKEYQMVLDNTPTFRKLCKRLYPEREIDKKIIKNENAVSYIHPKYSLLNNEEKILLLNIMFNAFTKNVDNDKPNKITLTDFARVLYLTKDSVDINIFDKNYASKGFYKKLNNGIVYSESLETRNKLISSLLKKIEILNLKSLIEHIESIKTTTIGNNKK